MEEETFTFEEESAAEQTAPVEDIPESTVEETVPGDDDFRADLTSSTVPDAEATTVTELEPVAFEPETPAVAPVSTTAPLALTEGQLREALAAASKDVIERIVWEVVPDLAEVLIKEAIRKIKEGQ